MTMRQMVQKFGLATMQAADDNWDNAYKSNMYTEHQIVHAIYPRSDYNPSRIKFREGVG